MERTESEKASEDGSQLNRNRSFKSKQLVRSQAIRESQSPPRTVSPSPAVDIEPNGVGVNVGNNAEINVRNNGDARSDTCHSDECDKDSCDEKKQPVEIQITSGGWDTEAADQRSRTRRWLVHAHSDPSRDLLSNNPRVACVCGACAACPHCRGRRRRYICTIKQDSGIACSDDCPDCSDHEALGPDGTQKADSVEIEERIYYCRCPERKEKPKTLSLSRTESEERMEPTGPDLVNFIKETLNKNARDRMTLLKIERELHSLVNDTGRCVIRFPVMTSYGRMLVHRCASLFQLSHHLDQANKTAVIVSKMGTCGGRIPCTSFKQWCTVTFPPSPHRNPPDNTLAKSILKRDTNSLDEPGNGSLANARSKSLEQRERDYERMKRRIFSSDNCSQDETQWPWLAAGPVKLLTPDSGRNKLIKVQSLEAGSGGSVPRRGAVSKSHSFGGYTASEPPQPRLLSRHGDLASSSWRLSPSSSGYKTLSLRSTDSVTPSPTGGASPEPSPMVGNPRGEPCPTAAVAPRVGDTSVSLPRESCPAVDSGPRFGEACPTVGSVRVANTGTVVCAVTDMSAVPPGALVINPQTGRPLTNSDGSLYHFDPANPPIIYDPGAYQENKIEQNAEKKRGKLEKQHSFIDHECECQPADETRKCCCECRRHDCCHRNTDKNTQDQRPKPASPCKGHYEQTDNAIDAQHRQYESTNQTQVLDNQQYEQANQTQAYHTAANDMTYETNYHNQRVYETSHRASFEQATNQRPSYEQAANQRPVNEVVGQRISKLTNQDSQEMYTRHYAGIRNDEVTSPQSQNHSYPQQDINIQGMVQAKSTPVPMPDPNMRPVSLTNMSYAQLPQGYPYVNQFRMDQPLQQMYQPGQMLPSAEDQKHMGTSPAQEPTFRIDPSYPYAAVDFASQCGACVDPNTMRSYNMPYGQVDIPQAVIPPSYPIPNVILPQPMQHCPYQEAVQWPPPAMVSLPPKLVVPELYPVYPNMYPQYNLLYPQVLPPPYAVCPPVYGVVDKQPARTNSAASAHGTPAAHEHDADHRAASTHSADHMASRRDSNEIAAKIQQIKEQMSQLNTRDRDRNKRTDEWRRRNNGSGILGSYPANMNGRVDRITPRPTNDETQLSSAARAIVNSIRNMQAKHTYPDNRREYQHRNERGDFRRRQEREGDRNERDKDNRRNVLQYRPPFILRQMSADAGTWCRRSSGPVPPVLNHPRRPHPDTRNPRR